MKFLTGALAGTSRSNLSLSGSLTAVLIGGVLLGASGCATLWSSGSVPLGDAGVRGAVAPADTAPEPPLAATTEFVYSSGEMLNLRVRLEARAPLDPDQVVVTARGLREGEVVAERQRKLREAVPEGEVEPGEAVVLDFALRNENLTEYQVRTEWGPPGRTSEAIVNGSPVNDGTVARKGDSIVTSAGSPESGVGESYAGGTDKETSVRGDTEPGSVPGGAEPATASELRDRAEAETGSEAAGALVDNPGLSIQELEQQVRRGQCGSPPCPVKAVLSFSVRNDARRAILEVVLAVGVEWVSEGERPRTPANFLPLSDGEERVAVPNVGLLPGASRKLRIALSTPIPYREGGRYIPYVRILSASSEQ